MWLWGTFLERTADKCMERGENVVWNLSIVIKLVDT